jgi:hypothetical protein
MLHRQTCRALSHETYLSLSDPPVLDGWGRACPFDKNNRRLEHLTKERGIGEPGIGHSGEIRPIIMDNTSGTLATVAKVTILGGYSAVFCRCIVPEVCGDYWAAQVRV